VVMAWSADVPFLADFSIQFFILPLGQITDIGNVIHLSLRHVQTNRGTHLAWEV
jgi:hypothetical protein